MPIRVGSYVLDALPAPATASDYERAVEEIEAALKRISGLVAIYATGGFSAPGISDIDRIAVFERRAQVGSMWSSLSQETKRLALHTPFVVDVETFARHRWFAHLEPLVLRWGSPVQFVEPPCRDLARRLVAIEGATTMALKLMRQAVMGRIKVRSALCELHTLRYSLSLGGLTEGDAGGPHQFARDAAQLRTDWFGLPAPAANERFIELVDDAWPATMEVLSALSGTGSKPDSHAPAHLRLGGAWANVVLASGESAPTAAAAASAGRQRVLWAGWERPAKAAWRAKIRTLRVPEGITDALSGVSESSPSFAAGRHEIVGAYRAFLAEVAPAYSGIGLAPQLQPR